MIPTLLALAAGALSWTFLEYWIHRYAGHVHRRNPFAREHLRHHAQGDDFVEDHDLAGRDPLVDARVGERVEPGRRVRVDQRIAGDLPSEFFNQPLS